MAKKSPDSYDWLKTLGLSSSGCSMLMSNSTRDKSILKNVNRFKEKYHGNNILYLECKPTYLICLTASPEKLRSFITIIGFVQELPKIQTQIGGIAASLGMNEKELDPKFMRKIGRRNFSKTPPLEELFIQGVAPIQSTQSEAKLLVKAFSENANYQEDHMGKMDYSNLNLFDNVLAEQHIADYEPSKKGLFGKDIYGQLINVESIIDTPITCGPGIFFSERENKYYAEHAGYVTYEDRTLNLVQTYVIEGNVDLRVGNINFVANVHVKGDLMPEFTVQASGNVRVDGTVSGASIIAEKDLNIPLGVLGQKKSFLKIGGSATMKFVNDSKVEVGRELTILKEALNSNLACLKEINAENAVIIGGRLVALKKIRVATIGSDFGIKTHVFLGEDYNHLKKTEEIRHRILEAKEAFEARLEGGMKEIRFWQEAHPQLKRNIDDLKAGADKIEELCSMANELDLLNQEFKLLSTEKSFNRVLECEVSKTIHAGTVFFCSGSILEIKEKIKGPVSIIAKEASTGHYEIKVSKKLK